MSAPTVDQMVQHAYTRLEEILWDLAKLDPHASVEDEASTVRSAYERTVQQVFPLVALASVLEANSGLLHYAADIGAHAQAAAVGFLPEPEIKTHPCLECPDAVGDQCCAVGQQLPLPDELIPQPKADA